MTLRPPDFEAADYPCDVCGKPTDSCICPQCPTCGEYGSLNCYNSHDLVRTPEQESSFATFCASCDDEAAYYDALAQAEEEAKALAEEIEQENNEYYESIINPDRV